MPTPSATIAIVDVIAFVDWNAQLRLTKVDSGQNPEGAAELAFKQTARRIARCLDAVDKNIRFRVMFRLYHGWHKGYEPTANRKAVKLVIAKTDFASLSQKPNVLFSPSVEFGDHLLYAEPIRLLGRLNCHLPNTLRSRFGSETEEKMVDTALAADVVALAHREQKNWIIVVTEDDDLIPPVYVAELALAGTTSRTLILQKNARGSMLNLTNLLFNG
ncbi:hypothetical protein [Pseudacidovorax intermedius]|uniref:hypothetical protein n=1 Tax=Pseudacidovorax intermedius TaxID=433924 RepID=UPI0026EB757B|nr:hypothetical protein [Pseudacidovorax intermedius]